MELMINNDQFGRVVEIYGWDKRGKNDLVIGFDGKHLIETTVPEAEIIPDTIPFLLRMPRPMFDDFVRSIVQYAQQKNIQTESENLLKGKLQATEQHVAVMEADRIKYFDIISLLIKKLPG